VGAILGIDLGTTNSSCAVFDEREPYVIPNDRGMRTTPSIVAFVADGSLLVGESAKNASLLDPALAVRAVKRRMGDDAPVIRFAGRSYSPVDISAIILGKLKEDAEKYLGEKADQAVITVPAYFSERQRRATREAGIRAGFDVRRIINEPTASALAYALKNRETAPFPSQPLPPPKAKRVLVYDLGGGTFDVTVLEMVGPDCRVLSSRGDDRLGGIDFDKLILDRISGEFRSRFGGPSFESDRMLMRQLADQTEKAKIELSSRESALIAIPFARSGELSHFTLDLARSDFENLIRPLLERTILLVRQALDDSGLAAGDIDALVLSGGSSRIPLVRELVSAEIGRPPEPKVSPEECVALGAAVLAAVLAGKLPDFKVRDVNSLPLGVEIEGNEFVRLIEKNEPIPVKRERLFTTVSDGQPSVEIHVLQGEDVAASANLSLGRFLLTGIRSGKRGEPRILVAFELDADEILRVSARDADTGAEQDITIQPERCVLRDGSGDALADRVASLIGRIRATRSERALDRSFEREIEGLLGAAEIAVRERDETALRESSLALETIIGELMAYPVLREAEL
jgi:molecular chaperone DnaK